MRNPAQITSRLILAAVATLVALVLAELICRLAFPEWAPMSNDRKFWVYDPVLGWFHEPGEKGRFWHPDFDVQVKINQAGLRDDDYATEKTPGVFRILVLGDSFAWGFGVEKDEIFCERIEQRNTTTELINAAVSGYGTDQEYLFLKHYGLDFHPDAVLLVLHPNDLTNNAKALEYWHAKPVFRINENGDLELHNSPVPKPNLTHRLGKWVLTRTWLYARLYRVLLKPILDRPAPPSTQPSPGSRSADTVEAPAKNTPSSPLGITAKLIVEIRNLCRENNAEFALTSVPCSHELEDNLAELCSQQSIPYLPLSQALSNADKPVTFPHDCHWTPYGHQVAADAIEAFIARLGWLSSDGDSEPKEKKAP